jgi:hypothetical protein
MGTMRTLSVAKVPLPALSVAKVPLTAPVYGRWPNIVTPTGGSPTAVAISS